ncbi:MAG: PQQ-dependent sugar dehydrogenase [Nitrospira sp.]|nr:PQQ-dependent sugar dehydrogenase [Nitrospira sp.]MCP9461027.1 PQQ-dependent sugar dehydrogenase [Nitrospira sp.]MCP9474066.1 PQQ-dependent sugar dehydrogenase [Nitrospira sp.]
MVRSPSPMLAFFLSLTAGMATGCGGTTDLPQQLPANNTVTLQLVTDRLSFPVFMASPPGDHTRLFVVEKEGLIRIVTASTGAILPTPFLDLRGQISTSGEQGLLGLAFDPDYSANGNLYIFYTNLSGNLVIARLQRSAGDPDRANQTSLTTLQAIDHSTHTNHNGGMLAFGPDRCLYAGIGDGGGGGDPDNNGQRLTIKLGKLLRLDPRTGGACTNEGVNPFVLSGGLPEIWSFGLRNPWRFSFDRATGDLYIADVGQNRREEINVSPAPSAGRQANYGWRIMEGLLCFNPATDCDQSGLTLPVLDYPHADGACSVIGGYVYRGTATPSLRGTYFYADYCAGFVRSFRYANGQASNQTDWPLLHRNGITSFGEDAQGELYLMTQGGSLYKLVPD